MCMLMLRMGRFLTLCLEKFIGFFVHNSEHLVVTSFVSVYFNQTVLHSMILSIH